ncbi:unnamed protein product, partial [Polarella glacialis]
GAILQSTMLLFTFMGILGGYTSARVYKVFGGDDWKMATIMTATFYPGIIFAIFFVLNLVMWGQKSTGAVPFTTILGSNEVMVQQLLVSRKDSEFTAVLELKVELRGPVWKLLGSRNQQVNNDQQQQQPPCGTYKLGVSLGLLELASESRWPNLLYHILIAGSRRAAFLQGPAPPAILPLAPQAVSGDNGSGAGAEQVGGLPWFQAMKANLEEFGDVEVFLEHQPQECMSCCQPIEAAYRARPRKCSHIFHVECLLHCWSEGTCPVCRASFAPEASHLSHIGRSSR